MENASKALLMAGGILLAILVISLLMIAVNNISDYNASSTELEAQSQLAEFNMQFTQFAQENCKGMDVISALNKIVDYNLKKSGPGELDYSQKITITVNVSGFNEKHSAHYLFGNTTTYTVTKQSDQLMKKIDEQRALENEYGLTVISALSSNESSLKSYYLNGNSDGMGRSVQEVIGKKVKDLEEKLKTNDGYEDLDRHAEYSNFKTSSFKGTVEDYYDNGQVKSLLFTWKN